VNKPTPPPGRAQSSLAAGLYIAATPIGNARDITLRVLDVLRDCDVILAEDTRQTAKLLAVHEISRPLLVYNDHNAPRVRPKVLERLKRGERAVLVSDAGTPLVSDPGYKLVREALAAGVQVHSLPGASATLTALALSGLPTDRFLFAGFLPTTEGPRRRILEELKTLRSTLIFFESPRRLAASLDDMQAVLGPRQGTVARELTKLHEEIRRGDLAQLAAHYASTAPPRGEITLVIAPPDKEAPDFALANALLDKALAFMPVRAAADLIADALKVPRRTAYALALSRKGKSPDDS
jgi:16S rRNA (cytidine1402-2'-O)-methyltransferase